MTETLWMGLLEYPGYLISNTGIVQTFWKMHGGGYGSSNITYYVCDNGRSLKPDIDKRNRQRVTLKNKSGKFGKRFVSNLILEAFIGQRPHINYQACHNDGNVTNNTLENLRWDSPSGNQQDKFKHGTDSSGSRSPVAKLSDQDVIEIIKQYNNGIALEIIAQRFNVTSSNICAIGKRKTWKYINV